MVKAERIGGWAVRSWAAAALAAGLLLLGELAAAHGGGALLLDPAVGRYVLSGYLEVLEDPDGKLTIADVVKPGAAPGFRPWARKGEMNFGYSRSAFWIKVTVT
jgi:hypothetical protein